jgi:hypothetical protein
LGNSGKGQDERECYANEEILVHGASFDRGLYASVLSPKTAGNVKSAKKIFRL